jgi:hypothetical protein
MKCERDSDCVTGLPDYECDESTPDWPNNNKCVKVCSGGQTRIDDCTCSGGTGNKVVCGPADVNNDGILNYKDFVVFGQLYKHECSDTPPTTGCGGMDTNGDGKIDFQDFYSFSQRYYPKATSCKL